MFICDHWFHAVDIRQSSRKRYHETNSRRKTSMLSLLYHIITLSKILSTLQIKPQRICHKPTKWDRDNHTLSLYIYIYIYIYISIYFIFLWSAVTVSFMCFCFFYSIQWSDNNVLSPWKGKSIRRRKTFNSV